MYIITKKKDYYDGVAGTMGIDKSIVYDRQIIEFGEDDMPTIFRRKIGFWGIRHRENPFRELAYHRTKKEYRDVCDEHAYFIIGFCGKLYVGWKLYRIIDKYNGVSTEITYDLEYIKSILEERSWHGSLEDSLNYVQSYDAINIFRELNAPVFVYDSDYNRTFMMGNTYNNHHPNFIINPTLKNYEFGRKFDAVQAFQEISMFMGGVLGKGEKEIVEVADKYKIAQHGFDKWSFRKESNEKK